MRTARLEGKKKSKLLQDVKEGLEKIQQAEDDKLESHLPTMSTADQEKEAILTVGKYWEQPTSSTILLNNVSPQRVPTASSPLRAAR